jgi:hypothetical protein
MNFTTKLLILLKIVHCYHYTLTIAATILMSFFFKAELNVRIVYDFCIFQDQLFYLATYVSFNKFILLTTLSIKASNISLPLAFHM